MDQDSQDSETTRLALAQAAALYEAILGRPIDAASIAAVAGTAEGAHADDSTELPCESRSSSGTHE